MKFILSALPTAMMTVAVMSVPVMTYASTAADSIEVSDDVTPVAVTQIIDADSPTDNDKPAVAPFHTVPNPRNAESQALSTLVDPITHKAVDNSYALDVSSFLSLEQAQKLLVQVSPKIAANQAAIAASEYQTDALRTIDNPLVFARVSASAYHLDEDIDLSSLRSGIVNEVNNGVDNIIPPTADLPDFGELVGERIPDSYNFKRSGSTSGAGLGVVWPIYTAGRTDALTGASDARTQEAMADSVLDKNELYNTLIERYFKAQLAIIAAYLREDAYDTLQQTDHMAERLFEEGFISRVDRLEAQSALADAKSESVNANNDARLAMIALQRLLRTDYRIKPTTPLFVSSRPLPDVSYFQDLALNNHPGLQKVAAKRAQAQQLHALSDTGYKPTVLLYGYGQVEKDPSWVAGISASWKLWGGLDKAASLASSNAKIRQADLSEIEVSDNLLLLVEKNWHDVNNAQSRYQALQSNVDLAAEVLRLRRLGLQEGVNTTVDVVQAQTQSLKARTEQAQAANDYVQSLAALMQSCGTPLAFNAYLNAADIQLPTLYTEQ
ncbi:MULTISPECIES: TolC family protein [Psychrobacter]|uniref:TolC family protein n=1 Tax=Psychrobacter TaxID=497 RepID=UPI000869975F|nr:MULTISPECIES: TolC family protein [Psychrobacter]MBA6245357.1 TolC family protein [Psychrobacter sp. Urea-trap-18]MBA6286901.1 TolC family protein [Psychrobacter sp. Urea-trap-16]MBA6317917.1 TolC family protein [Psychrobacter sp. Urea-trap-20]MBA6335162.1 TolC family protein [Psychrobacter sp. Urea-trap-19]OEH69063.1 MAG: transporter [Psychrobacter sp. B29-1]|tara:strand:- start:68803 stop:70461 length:1659 start_codon:yes stop_codon:yes gene_type:complete